MTKEDEAALKADLLRGIMKNAAIWASCRGVLAGEYYQGIAVGYLESMSAIGMVSREEGDELMVMLFGPP
ncbi:MAG: hypothetical protein M0Z41_08540 [Peptococcaceae bacterium]|jgi:hypothetical protein|nr:hypothetical protein [Peptococcaceae bacterium]